LKKPLAIKH
jgi:hypothetical protein